MVDQDQLNMQVRKFLKQVGVTSQREIEQAVAKALAEGRLQGEESVGVRMTLEVAELGLVHTVESTLDLKVER